MNDESLNYWNYNINNNNNEEDIEENTFSEYDDSNYIKQSILFCLNKYCNLIPEIYLMKIHLLYIYSEIKIKIKKSINITYH